MPHVSSQVPSKLMNGSLVWVSVDQSNYILHSFSYLPINNYYQHLYKYLAMFISTKWNMNIKVDILFCVGADKTHKWQEPKFATECFFFAVHCHHISIVPVFRKYQRLVRAVRELKHMIEELESADENSIGYTDQQRRRVILDRWRSQIVVSISLFTTYNLDDIKKQQNGPCKAQIYNLYVYIILIFIVYILRK